MKKCLYFVGQIPLLLDLFTIFRSSLNWCSWRALRVQKISGNEVGPAQTSSLSVLNNNWKEDLFSYDIGEEDDCESDDDIDLEELGRALSEAANLTSTSKSRNNDVECSRKPQPTRRPARPIDDNVPGILDISV